jgi:hypothetical protein
MPNFIRVGWVIALFSSVFSRTGSGGASAPGKHPWYSDHTLPRIEMEPPKRSGPFGGPQTWEIKTQAWEKPVERKTFAAGEYQLHHDI